MQWRHRLQNIVEVGTVHHQFVGLNAALIGGSESTDHSHHKSENYLIKEKPATFLSFPSHQNVSFKF